MPVIFQGSQQNVAQEGKHCHYFLNSMVFIQSATEQWLNHLLFTFFNFVVLSPSKWGWALNPRTLISQLYRYRTGLFQSKWLLGVYNRIVITQYYFINFWFTLHFLFDSLPSSSFYLIIFALIIHEAKVFWKGDTFFPPHWMLCFSQQKYWFGFNNL